MKAGSSTTLARSLKAALAGVSSLGLLSVSAFGQLQSPPGQTGAQGQPMQVDPQVQQELVQVRQQLQQLEGRLQQIEQEAMKREELQQAQSAFIEKLREAAIASDPDVQSKLERQDELIGELEDSPELQKSPEERSPEVTEKLTEFQRLRNEINPVVQSVATQPEIQERQAAFEEAVVEGMKEVDPEADQLLAQRAQLFGRYEQLASQIQ